MQVISGRADRETVPQLIKLDEDVSEGVVS